MAGAAVAEAETPQSPKPSDGDPSPKGSTSSHWTLVGKDISDIRLGDIVDLLETVPKYLRAMSLSIRSMFSTSTEYVEVFSELQREFGYEASVLKIFLIPLVIEVAGQMQRLLNEYLLSSCEVWPRKIDDTARSVKEYQILFHCMADFFGILKQDLEKYPPKVEAVRKALVQETMKFQREAGVLSIRSLIKDDVFVQLLFCPDVDFYAAPLCHGGERHDFQKPVVAKDEFERAVAASMTITGSLMPAVDKLLQLLVQMDVFLRDFLEELEDELWGSSAPPPPVKQRDPWADYGKSEAERAADKKQREEEEAAAVAPRYPPELQEEIEAKRRRHYNIVLPKTYWLEKKIRDMLAIRGSILNDMLCLPVTDPRDYYQTWLETRTCETGEDIIDIARAATKNVEITDALDP